LHVSSLGVHGFGPVTGGRLVLVGALVGAVGASTGVVASRDGGTMLASRGNGSVFGGIDDELPPLPSSRSVSMPGQPVRPQAGTQASARAASNTPAIPTALLCMLGMAFAIVSY
jgi:hypothetical protein